MLEYISRCNTAHAAGIARQTVSRHRVKMRPRDQSVRFSYRPKMLPARTIDEASTPNVAHWLGSMRMVVDRSHHTKSRVPSATPMQASTMSSTIQTMGGS